MYSHDPIFVSANRLQRFLRERREGADDSHIAMTNAVHPEVLRVIMEAAAEFDDFDERVVAEGGVTVEFEDFSARFEPIAKSIEFSPTSTPTPPGMSSQLPRF